MSDSVTTSQLTNQGRDQDDLTENQEYMIGGIVILLFGLLYWFLNQGGNSSSDLDLVTGSHAPDIQLESRLGELKPSTSAAQAGVATLAATTTPEADPGEPQQTTGQNIPAESQATAAPLPLTNKEIAELKAAESALTQSNAVRERAAEETKNQADAISKLDEANIDNVVPDTDRDQDKGKEQPNDNQTASDDNSTSSTNINTDTKAKPQTQTYTLPDGTKIDISSKGFEGNLKSAIVNHELFKPIAFDNIYFESGSTTIKAESDHQLKATAALLHHYKDTHILLRGHTDSTGGISRNVQLSLYRANAMALALGELGIDTKRIRIIGVGAAEPIASNKTDEGRNKNRRIEVLITK